MTELPSEPKRPPNIEERLNRIEERQRLLRTVVMRGFWEAMDKLDDLRLPGKSMRCPICDRMENRDHLEQRIEYCLFGGGRLERYICPGCGCVYGPSKYLDLSASMVEADYALLYDEYSEANSTENELRVFRSISAGTTGPYLNWGCGRWSQSISALRAEGQDVWGYEPSATSDQAFVVTDKAQISAQFGAIYSNNVIEHMPRPVETFNYFHSILRPGGRMAHASPCYRYAYGFTRFHVIFLTGNAPEVLAARTGFRVVAKEEDGEYFNCLFERI